jgi:hypothetical protein
MKLYHGSNMSINEIDLKRGRRGKDFGQGFYLSADRSQAQMMAERTVDREESGEASCSTSPWTSLFASYHSSDPHSSIFSELSGPSVYSTKLRTNEYKGRTRSSVPNRVSDKRISYYAYG